MLKFGCCPTSTKPNLVFLREGCLLKIIISSNASSSNVEGRGGGDWSKIVAAMRRQNVRVKVTNSDGTCDAAAELFKMPSVPCPTSLLSCWSEVQRTAQSGQTPLLISVRGHSHMTSSLRAIGKHWPNIADFQYMWYTKCGD